MGHDTESGGPCWWLSGILLHEADVPEVQILLPVPFQNITGPSVGLQTLTVKILRALGSGTINRSPCGRTGGKLYHR